jgi:hypothetical protein
MFIRKLSDGSAFVAVDFPDVAGKGNIRLAKKILQGGAKDFARSFSYSLACLELQETGISAGISSLPENREEAIKGFVAEVSGWEIDYTFQVGKGVSKGEMSDLEDTSTDEALFFGAVLAAKTAFPEAKTAVTDLEDPTLLETELKKVNVDLVVSESPFTAEADLLFVGKTMGALGHEIVPNIQAKVIVPTTRLAVTTRGLAHCVAKEIVVLPDFITAAGHFMGGDVVSLMEPLVKETLDHPEGPVLGACYKAESFLSTWCPELPFGRPI